MLTEGRPESAIDGFSEAVGSMLGAGDVVGSCGSRGLVGSVPGFTMHPNLTGGGRFMQM